MLEMPRHARFLMRTLSFASAVCLVFVSCAAPVGTANQGSGGTSNSTPRLLVKQITSTAGMRALAAGDTVAADKPWLRATDYSKIPSTDMDTIQNWGVRTLIDQYDQEFNFSRALTLVDPPPQAVGGGILFYVRDADTQASVPVAYQDGQASFTTEVGKSYIAYVELFLDGANGTEIDGVAVDEPFVSTGNDTISFYVTGESCTLYINGESFGGTYLWTPEDPTLPYDAGSYNAVGKNSEGRSAFRKRNFELYGGYGFVAEFLHS